VERARIICYGPKGSVENPSWTEVELRVRRLALHPPWSLSVCVERAGDHLELRRAGVDAYHVSLQTDPTRFFAAGDKIDCGMEDGRDFVHHDRPPLTGAIEAAKHFYEDGSLAPTLVWFCFNFNRPTPTRREHWLQRWWSGKVC
jgi:hypothetical protein